MRMHHVHAGLSGAAAFLDALPQFAKPAPPTPMSAIVAEMDADYHGLVTKLMSAINKPGSPCQARARMHASMPLPCMCFTCMQAPQLRLLASWQPSLAPPALLLPSCKHVVRPASIMTPQYSASRR